MAARRASANCKSVRFAYYVPGERGAVTDLFVSYKAEDRGRVAPLVEALESDGLSIWWDAHIGGGDDWRDTILRNLEAARCAIVIWSRRSIGKQGQFVRDEATRALKRGTYFPVRIDKVDPPLGFGESQALDLTGWKGDRNDPRYQAMLRALRKRLGVKSNPDSSQPGDQARVSRRTLIGAGAAAAAAATGAGGWLLLRPGRREASDSIAVLPFANLSGDPAQAYFSDGIAEELRAVLARIPGLKVVARTSSEVVRNADARTAASRLHVRNILTGSVRRSPSMLRISAQLVDGPKGTERWSEVYDRPVGDSLQIQTDIANMVAQALSIHLEAHERNALTEGGTNNSEAEDLLLQAKEIVWRDDDQAALHSGLELVNRALSLDPQYADALTAKASILGYLAAFLGTGAAEARARAQDAETTARQAVRIAPRSAQAHAALANIWWIQLRFRDGLAEFEKMEALPRSASSYFNGIDPYSIALLQSRRLESALARTDQLIAADPFNPTLYSTKAIVLGHSRRYPEAEQVIRQAIALGPKLDWPRAFHAYFLMQMGQLDEATAEFTALGGTGPWLSWAAVAAERQGRRAEADRLVAVMQASMGDGAHYQYAEVYAQQGRDDEAIAALERAWKARDPGLGFLQVDPMFDPLRKDRRFEAIVDRLEFPT
jgi:serine/threonine-protein kinase